VARHAPTLLALALLVATASAFAVTEHLKLQPSPIVRPDVDTLFSPVCGCRQDEAHIAFALRNPGTITLTVLDGNRDAVRTLVSDRHYGREPIRVPWDGRYADGRLVPDGTYRLRLDLARRAPILMPNRIQVDTRAPRARVVSTTRAVISPDGDDRFDGVTLVYRLDEPAKAALSVGDHVHERKKLAGTAGRFRWYGRLGPLRLPAGTYGLSVAATDDAGNTSQPTPPVAVRVRFIELARQTIRVPQGARFGVRVRTDARRFRWRLGGRRGRAGPGQLVLRAPQRPGRFYLYVEANGRADRARIVVTRRQ
jgi:hypothetical protein